MSADGGREERNGGKKKEEAGKLITGDDWTDAR